MKVKYNFDIKSVIFDMDGVITDTMPYHYRAWRKIFSDAGVKMSRMDIYLREGQSSAPCVKEIFALDQKAISDKQVQQVLAQKEKLFKKIFKQRFILGARSFIRKLHAQGFQLGLVTGTARHELLKILPKNLRNLFDVIITGDEVSRGKPHPEPYQKALKVLKCKRSDAIVIENAPFGIQSAKAAGIYCLAIETSLPKKYLKKADQVFHSFKHLKNNVCLSKR
ncbi:MAG: HAD family phosphatase [Candidatus Aceula meridiana]|nr:HAD family phosphatase [Candidatus Aceula meridiana]